MTPLSLFAVTAPGLEALAEQELRAMGIEARAEPGGVAWEGDSEQMQMANLRLRTASRVIVRVAEFKARAFYEMERHTKRIAWERFLRPGSTVHVRVTSSKSKLYHEGAIAQRVMASISARIGGVLASSSGEFLDDEAEEEPALEAASGAADDEARRAVDGWNGPEAAASGGAGDAAGAAGATDAEAAPQMFVVRFHRDRCTISADSSGELLHRRGYRLAVARAPLRETLACAILHVSGWEHDAPLLDPFCGAGTIPIEAALAARRIAPGLARADRMPRAYAFESWPEHEPALWTGVVERARSEILSAAPAAILGSDRDAGAVEAAMANARRAGVADDVELSRRTISDITAPAGRGWLATNPPYGHRVGDTERLRNLYASLGRVSRDRLAGWKIALLSAEPRLERQTGIEFTDVVRTRNGGIPVRVVVGRA